MITSFQDLLSAFGSLLASLIPILVAIALLVFLWGLAKFIFHSGDEKSIEGGRKLMIWGVIGLFVMVSVWGIITFLQQDIVGNGVSAPANIKYKTLNPPASTGNPAVDTGCADDCGF